MAGIAPSLSPGSFCNAYSGIQIIHHHYAQGLRQQLPIWVVYRAGGNCEKPLLLSFLFFFFRIRISPATIRVWVQAVNFPISVVCVREIDSLPFQF